MKDAYWRLQLYVMQYIKDEVFILGVLIGMVLTAFIFLVGYSLAFLFV